MGLATVGVAAYDPSNPGLSVDGPIAIAKVVEHEHESLLILANILLAWLTYRPVTWRMIGRNSPSQKLIMFLSLLVKSLQVPFIYKNNMLTSFFRLTYVLYVCLPMVEDVALPSSV